MSRPKSFPEILYAGMSSENEMMIIPSGTLTEHLEFMTIHGIKGIIRYNKQSCVLPFAEKSQRKPRKPKSTKDNEEATTGQ